VRHDRAPRKQKNHIEFQPSSFTFPSYSARLHRTACLTGSAGAAPSRDELLRRRCTHGVVFEIADRDRRRGTWRCPVKQAGAHEGALSHPTDGAGDARQEIALQTGARATNPAIHQMWEPKSRRRHSGAPCEPSGRRRPGGPRIPPYVDVACRSHANPQLEALDYVRLVVPRAAC